MKETIQITSQELDALFERYRKAPDSYVFVVLADACRKMDRVDEALDICEQGVAKHPGYASGHVVRGKCLFDLDRRDEAHETFAHVLQLDANNLVALKYLGLIEAARGDYEAARERLKHILVLDPDNREIKRALQDIDQAETEDAADTNGLHGDADASSAPGWDIELGDELETSDELASLTLAEIFAAQGYAEKARAIFEELLRKQPNNAVALEKLRALDGEPVDRSTVEHPDDIETGHWPLDDDGDDQIDARGDRAPLREPDEGHAVEGAETSERSTRADGDVRYEEPDRGWDGGVTGGETASHEQHASVQQGTAPGGIHATDASPRARERDGGRTPREESAVEDGSRTPASDVEVRLDEDAQPAASGDATSPAVSRSEATADQDTTARDAADEDVTPSAPIVLGGPPEDDAEASDGQSDQPETIILGGSPAEDNEEDDDDAFFAAGPGEVDHHVIELPAYYPDEEGISGQVGSEFVSADHAKAEAEAASADHAKVEAEAASADHAKAEAKAASADHANVEAEAASANDHTTTSPDTAAAARQFESDVPKPGKPAPAIADRPARDDEVDDILEDGEERMVGLKDVGAEPVEQRAPKKEGKRKKTGKSAKPRSAENEPNMSHFRRWINHISD